MPQPQVIENINVITDQMRGILGSILVIYVIIGFLAALWLRSRPKCSSCKNRIRLGKGVARWSDDPTAKKVWTHYTCEKLAQLNAAVHQPQIEIATP